MISCHTSWHDCLVRKKTLVSTENIQTSGRKSRDEPKTFSLWGSSATHQATALPSGNSLGVAGTRIPLLVLLSPAKTSGVVAGLFGTAFSALLLVLNGRLWGVTSTVSHETLSRRQKVYCFLSQLTDRFASCLPDDLIVVCEETICHIICILLSASTITDVIAWQERTHLFGYVWKSSLKPRDSFSTCSPAKHSGTFPTGSPNGCWCSFWVAHLEKNTLTNN